MNNRNGSNFVIAHEIAPALNDGSDFSVRRISCQRFGELKGRLPGNGPLFPYLRTVRAGDRATEFKQRCDGLGIKGVSLHSYRYAWAERAKAAGYPERYAQVNLGHNSKAMTRAYSRKAEVEMPSLSEYERQQKAIIASHETEPVTQSVAA
jgi:integrase